MGTWTNKTEGPTGSTLKAAFAALSLAAFLPALMTSSAQGADYSEIDVVDGGKVQGSVFLGSAREDTQTFQITKDLDVCGGAKRDVAFVEASDGKLLNAVVYLSDIKTGKPVSPEGRQLTIDQKECSFGPVISVMMHKDRMDVSNSDPVSHNFHSFEQIGKVKRTMMNISQPDKGVMQTQPVRMRRGVGMKIECDAHEFMHAWVFVARNPYYAMVDENGAFEIGDIPAGTYTVKAWHGVLGDVDGGTIVVAADGTAKVDLSF